MINAENLGEGLKADKHGHVVVLVPGPLSHGKYPTAYWGSLGGVPKKYTTLKIGRGIKQIETRSFTLAEGSNESTNNFMLTHCNFIGIVKRLLL